MSGNGVRCLAWAAERAGLVDGDVLAVRTRAGEKHVTLQRDRTGAVTGASVDMGAVTFAPEAIPLAATSSLGLVAEFHGVRYEGDAVGMGNPHLVLFVDDPETARVPTHGQRLERDDRFPSRTNVEFVTVSADRAIEMRVWERGVGETLSCGTGACAAAAAAHRRGLVDERVRVRVRGGVLSVELGDSVVLGGPVRHVFDVVVDVARLVEQST